MGEVASWSAAASGSVTSAEPLEGYAHYGASAIRRWFAATYFPLVLTTCMVGIYYLHTQGMALELIPLVSGPYCGILVLIGEKVQPHTRRWWPKWREDVGVDTLFAFVYGIPLQIIGKGIELATRALVLLLGLSVSSVTGGGLWPTSWPLVAQFFLAVGLADFAGYWAHRVLHETQWGWRFHSVHHSPSVVYWWNSTRHHLVDSVGFSIPALGLLILFGIPELVLALYGAFAIAQGYFQHSNIRLTYWPLCYVFSTNLLHRWHHSKNPRDANANYGTILILWDLVFRTFHLPRDRTQHVEDIGVDYANYPRSFLGQSLIPFRWRRLEEGPERTRAAPAEGGEGGEGVPSPQPARGPLAVPASEM